MGKIFLVIVGFIPHIVPIYILSTSELGVGLHEDLSEMILVLDFNFNVSKFVCSANRHNKDHILG